MAPEDPSMISPTRPTRISGIFPDSPGLGEEAPVSPGGRPALDGLLIVVTAGVLWARSHRARAGESG